jgi:hypothetical protein
MRALSCILLIVAASCGPMSTGPEWKKSESNTTERLNALFGFGPSDLWAAGDDGAIVHFNGTSWTRVDSGTSRTIKSIWGATANDVWFVGDSGAVLRWDGSTISAVTGAPTSSFVAVRGSATNSVFLCSSVGLHFFDGTFHEFTRGGNHVDCSALFSLGGTTVGALVDKNDTSSASQVMTLSNTGGTVFTPAGDLNVYESTVVGVTPTDLWVLQQNSKSIKRVGNGAPLELVLPDNVSAKVGWANGPNDVWLGGGYGALTHYDGTKLELTAAGDYDAPVINAIWGTTGVTWAAGDDGWLLQRVETTP